jgi:2-polyprenyl-3-methyl-5-hydroxy-6-metoxy-1,4-benzoquinol methylase
MKPLLSPYLRRRRMEPVRPYLKGNILDIGCGTGELVHFVDEDQRYCGIDSNTWLVRKLRETYPQHAFYDKNLDEEPLNLGEKFDTITLVAVIEHLYNPRNLLRQCKNLLSDKGHIVITTPTAIGGKLHKFLARLRLTDRYAAREHKRFYGHDEIKAVLPCDLEIEKYQKFQFGMNQLFVCKHSGSFRQDSSESKA